MESLKSKSLGSLTQHDELPSIQRDPKPHGLIASVRDALVAAVGGGVSELRINCGPGTWQVRQT